MDAVKFKKLEEEFESLKPALAKVSDSILDQEVSKYPIFVVHQHDVEVGVEIIDGKDHPWSVHASSLEEFVSKQLIETHKIDSFRTVFKDPRKYLCLFVLSDLGANFIFLPRLKKELGV